MRRRHAPLPTCPSEVVLHFESSDLDFAVILGSEIHDAPNLSYFVAICSLDLDSRNGAHLAMVFDEKMTYLQSSISSIKARADTTVFSTHSPAKRLNLYDARGSNPVRAAILLKKKSKWFSPTGNNDRNPGLHSSESIERQFKALFYDINKGATFLSKYTTHT